jgi:hypothetical protein
MRRVRRRIVRDSRGPALGVLEIAPTAWVAIFTDAASRGTVLEPA